MARLHRVGRATSNMQLRSQKRDFTSTIAVMTTSNDSSPESQKKKTVKPKRTSFRPKFIVAPTSSKFPILTALKKQRVDPDSIDHDKILLKYPNLIPARLIRRYKRFLADVVLLDGIAKDETVEIVDKNLGTKSDGDGIIDDEEVVTVYCPNTGPMVGLLEGLPNARVQLSKSSDPKRKYAYTLEMIQINNGERDVWVGVHSTSANRMIEQALTSRWLTELGHYDSVRREVKFANNSRVDFVLTTNAKDGTIVHEKYVEVKSVTLAMDGRGKSSSRCAVFPDTVSTRAQKHVTELTDLLSTTTKGLGNRKETATHKVSGTIVFLVQRDDCTAFAPSIQHDKKFAELCAIAAKSGIQILAYACALEPDETKKSGTVRLLESLPLHGAAS
ncbi:unnamed protein product [Peronospora farinosa]|uniref:Sugar fermentation stimulation protein n=1 Tax=Peronospora farinosa TaxID=134698 RepID=A0AAV0TXX0_9STRA|nr:unnamed protein product [Peronospora farinosa]CAI5728950.1 unnamed protein product [Peronospora farinosa]